MSSRLGHPGLTVTPVSGQRCGLGLRYRPTPFRGAYGHRIANGPWRSLRFACALGGGAHHRDHDLADVDVVCASGSPRSSRLGFAGRVERGLDAVLDGGCDREDALAGAVLVGGEGADPWGGRAARRRFRCRFWRGRGTLPRGGARSVGCAGCEEIGSRPESCPLYFVCPCASVQRVSCFLSNLLVDSRP